MLDALTPLAIKAALQVAALLQAQAEQADALRATHVQRARHCADAARRRYLAVDPANRLVADALEADWNARLRDLADAEDDYQRAREQAAGPLTGAQLGQVRALAADLPALWHNPATSMKDRKRLIRLLITDVTLLKDGDTIIAHVRLPGGQDRTLTVPRPLAAWEAHTTPGATVTLISSLLDEHPFHEIAVILGERGITGGWGRPYTVHSLAAVCRDRGIPDHGIRLRAAGYLTAAETAAQLAPPSPPLTSASGPDSSPTAASTAAAPACSPRQQRPAQLNNHRCEADLNTELTPLSQAAGTAHQPPSIGKLWPNLLCGNRR